MRKSTIEHATCKTLLIVITAVAYLGFFSTPTVGQQESGAIVEEAHLLIGGNIGNVYLAETPPEYAYLIGTGDEWGEIYVTFNYEDSTSETLSVSIPWDWSSPPGDWTGTYAYRKYVGINPVRCSRCTMFEAGFINPNPTKKVISIRVSDDWVSWYPWSDVFALTVKSSDVLKPTTWYSDDSGYYFLEKDDTNYFNGIAPGGNNFPEYSIYNGIKFYTHGQNDWTSYGRMDLQYDRAVMIGIELSDITPPTTTIALSGTLGNNDWYTSNVQVTLTATDNEGGSGVKNTEYSFDGTNWNAYTVPFTMTYEGTTTVYYRSTDNAGNVESTKSQTVNIDKTPPVITGIPTITKISADFNDNDISDWVKNTNGNADVTADSGRMRLRVYKCSDADAYKDLGFVSGEITVDFDWATSGDGWYEYPGWKLIVDGVIVVDDNVPVTQWYGTNSGHITKRANVIGNVQLAYRLRQSQYCSYGDHGNTYYWVDNVVVNTVVNANNWYNTDVVVKFTASDDLSGIDTVTPDTIISTEGASQSITGTAIDKAGNSASTTVSGINIDKTPPIIIGSRTPAPNINDWNNVDVTVHFDCSDGLSGVDHCTPDLIASIEVGGMSVVGTAKDKAGNPAIATVNDINIDKTPPTITGAPTTSPNENNWYNSDVTVRFTCDDTLSEPLQPFFDTLITLEGFDESVIGSCEDKAGNSNSATVSGINVDKTPPQVIINTPANVGVYILNQALIADWSATDSLSGIASATGTLPSGATIDTGTVGTKTFTVTATDIASNTATQTASYIIVYNFLGILPPIKTDGSSIFNLGRTVPVKFRIAGANGNYVSTATASLTYQYITNEILGTVEEAVSTSAASEGNTFRYDSTDNLYIFNLGTEGMSTGTYQLNINLDDGTVHTVRISLR